MTSVGDKKSFSERVKKEVNGIYQPTMRRFIQTIALYEADRCLQERYQVLRPFQRKIALYDVCTDLIGTLKFIPESLTVSIMFRTASGGVLLTPELAWRRMKQVDKDIEKSIIPNLMPLLNENKSHKDVCSYWIQQQYEKHPAGQEGVKYPDGWEHSHLHTFMIYKMYYKGNALSSNIPIAVDPNPYRVVPNRKPEVYPPEIEVRDPSKGHSFASKGMLDLDDKEENDEEEEGISYGEDASNEELEQIVSNDRGEKSSHSMASLHNEVNKAAQKRRLVLQEVREHLNLLKTFEDVISSAELNERKKELFKCLPPPPPPPPPPSIAKKRDFLTGDNSPVSVENKKKKVENIAKV